MISKGDLAVVTVLGSEQERGSAMMRLVVEVWELGRQCSVLVSWECKFQDWMMFPRTLRIVRMFYCLLVVVVSRDVRFC